MGESFNCHSFQLQWLLSVHNIGMHASRKASALQFSWENEEAESGQGEGGGGGSGKSFHDEACISVASS